MSTLNTYNCDKCDYSVSGYKKMKPFKYRSLSAVLLKKKSNIEYECNEDYHDTPCPKCDRGVLHIDQKATIFFHDKEEPEIVLESKKLPLFKTKRIDYKCTDCWYRIHGHQSIFRELKRTLSAFFFNKHSEPLCLINQNYTGEQCPICKTGTFIKYPRRTKEEEVQHLFPSYHKLTQKKCVCTDPYCAKCLSVNCSYDDCLVHTKEAKENWKKRRLE